ncbi:MAG: dicarboxylate/amino acid:cation symporter [Candidatus Improbicoccus pseudotrichonymphae]|uniref:Dicarboxylate/amino acid:cation symporter n=1 Tax=Candidatus Improbicoccus pseudotrichonymphae TaxID=3033792 RepID=A0AA48I7Z1_9FIRM|nr:MAG: dicarboxylate/amino acid:cation symporter [Candidatus Improbicoccus pseudotrichonymphae]
MLGKYGFIVRIFVSIILAVVLGYYNPWVFVSNFALIISNVCGVLISFFVPLIVLAFVTRGIISIKKSSGKILIITILLSYSFMFAAGITSYFVDCNVFPSFFKNFSSFCLSDNSGSSFASGLFKLEIKPIMEVIPAIIIAFILGLGANAIDSRVIKEVLDEFYRIVELVVKKTIIPLLPFYVFGTFFKLSSTNRVMILAKTFYKVFLVIILMHWSWLVVQFIFAGVISKKNPFGLIKNIFKVYFTAFATQSSVATIPVSVEAAKKNDVCEEVANFVSPLCSTIHLTGSVISIISSSIAVMILNGYSISFITFFPFTVALSLMMIAAPGLPCGAILAASSLLTSFLKFNPEMVSLMIALHIFQDGFGTACNVCGDNAVAIIIDKIYKKDLLKK